MRSLIFAWLALAITAQDQAELKPQSWTVDGVERTALVAEPAKSPEKTAVPLVLVFHGHGGTSEKAARSFKIHEAWPEALVIYPQGLPTSGRILDFLGEYAGWQHLAGMDGDRDVKLVDEILSWAKSRYTIDPAHTFAAGHSNGGSMVYVLWSSRPDRFAAFAPSSSVFPAAVIGTAKPKPVFIVAGRQDSVVPFMVQEYSLKGVLRINEADDKDKSWSGDARRHAPRKSGRGAEVVTYIHDGTHSLPSDAGALMVKFFREVSSQK